MRNLHFPVLVLGVMIAVSGFTPQSSYAQDESNGNPFKNGSFFIDGGFSSSIFNDQSISLYQDWTLLKYKIVKIGAGYEVPLGVGYAGLGLEVGYTSGTSFGGTGGKNFVPFALTGSYTFPVVKNILFIGPRLKLGAFGINEDSLKMFLLTGAQLEAELRIPFIPFGLYASGGVDLFPTGYKFGIAPVVGIGLRFPRPTGSKSGDSAASQRGNIAVTSAIPGEILIDGSSTGTAVRSGETATIRNVGTGEVEVAVREADGQITRANNMVTVRPRQTVPVRIDRSTGRVEVTSAIPGELLIDNKETGAVVSSGGTVAINDVNTGDREIALRDADGQIIGRNTVTVREGETSYVRIERPTQYPLAHPEGGFNIFRADGSTAEGFRVRTPEETGRMGEFDVIRLEDYENWLLSPIYFEPDSADLIETYRPVLESVGQYLSENPGLRLLLRSYTAPFGTAAGRLMVSEWRADFSRNYMMQNYGISANRISAELYGSERIPREVTTASTWVSYRCVELIIY